MPDDDTGDGMVSVAGEKLGVFGVVGEITVGVGLLGLGLAAVSTGSDPSAGKFGEVGATGCVDSGTFGDASSEGTLGGLKSSCI